MSARGLDVAICDARSLPEGLRMVRPLLRLQASWSSRKLLVSSGRVDDDSGGEECYSSL